MARFNEEIRAMYKYSCRKCPIRNRCIEESDNPSTTKNMVRAAFEAKTDTLATWATLQKKCLLVEADKARSRSALSDRLQKIEDLKDVTDELEIPDALKQRKSKVIRRLRPLTSTDDTADRAEEPPEYLKPVSPSKIKRSSNPIKRLASTQTLASAAKEERYRLTIPKSGRHIALPIEGEVTLGRFDPNVGIPPDVDLSYEDRNKQLVSRRHATIMGRNKQHIIEDLGSRAGIYVNGDLIEHSILEPGDHISLGNVQMIYERIPPEVFEEAKSKQARHTLLVTPTWRKIVLPYSQVMVIGRADSRVNWMPDVDMSQEGALARLVSRRHAVIRWRYGHPYIEDLGSKYGTKLKGDVLTLEEAVPLKPGDHIWLAGLVLAYDVEI